MSKALKDMTNEELWALFPIILTEYNPAWPLLYEVESQRLVENLGTDNVIRISHFGSTSVPGLRAKPTIDILLEIPPLADDSAREAFIAQIKAAGYEYSYQPDNPAPHMMFMKGYTPQGFKGQAYHLHVRYYGDWDELYFCAYLRRHPEVASEYGALKQQLMATYRHDRDGYTSAKTAFIRRYTAMARIEVTIR